MKANNESNSKTINEGAGEVSQCGPSRILIAIHEDCEGWHRKKSSEKKTRWDLVL